MHLYHPFGIIPVRIWVLLNMGNQREFMGGRLYVQVQQYV